MSDVPIPVHSPASVPLPSPPWPGPFTHFLGLDWATQHHVVCLVDRSGVIALRLDFSDDVVGWKSLADKLDAVAPRACICATVETSKGVVVEKMLQLQLAVYPIRPVAAKAYRQRKAPSGVKDDMLDAWSMADALRTDGYGWKRIRPEDPIIAELLLLCRDEVHLIEKRTACVLELGAALREYYPTVLEAFDVLTLQCVREFLKKYPTPAVLNKAGERSWQKFLKTHRLTHPETHQKRMDAFARAGEWSAPEATVRAKSLLAVSLAEQLIVIDRMLDEYSKRIGELFDSHPNAHLFGSLPGVGSKLAPRLMAGIGDIAKFADAQELQAYAGTAPVTNRSGNSCYVKIRRACDMMLRSTVRHWATHSVNSCAWAKVYCDSKRQTKGYETALRCLGQRWIKILWNMLLENKPYDEARHTRDQIEHGSWRLTLEAEPKPTLT